VSTFRDGIVADLQKALKEAEAAESFGDQINLALSADALREILAGLTRPQDVHIVTACCGGEPCHWEEIAEIYTDRDTAELRVLELEENTDPKEFPFAVSFYVNTQPIR
jgi:hypothetical protein